METKTGTAEHAAAVATRLVAEQESRIERQRSVVAEFDRDGHAQAARHAQSMLDNMVCLREQLKTNLKEAEERASLEALMDQVSRDCPL